MNIGARNYSAVKVENTPDTIFVPISSGKPEIPELIRNKWQNVVDLTAKILDVSASLITCFSENKLQIYASSKTADNPFTLNETTKLGTGLFCETVAGRKKMLAIPDVNESEYWKNNPLSSTGMRSYFGMPLLWEDGELFGTLCILDKKSNTLTPLIRDLLVQFREMLESDLKYIMLHTELEKRLTAQEMLIREAHHRINNHFTLLISYIQLQAAESGSNHDVSDILLDIQNRIRSISVIHEELCGTSTNRVLPPLDEYIEKLSQCLIDNVTGTVIHLECTVEKLNLPVELSVSIGLIISELVTNSIKYAFAGVASPLISIDIRRLGSGRLAIRYRDNGKGLPDGFDIRRSPSLGMNLIKLQVEQLHGKLEVSGEEGVAFGIEIDG